MIEIVKFTIFAACIIGLMYLIRYGCQRLTMKIGINPKIVTTIVIVVVFLISSFVWSFTGFYEWLSGLTGIPLEKR